MASPGVLRLLSHCACNFCHVSCFPHCCPKASLQASSTAQVRRVLVWRAAVVVLTSIVHCPNFLADAEQQLVRTLASVVVARFCCPHNVLLLYFLEINCAEHRAHVLCRVLMLHRSSIYRPYPYDDDVPAASLCPVCSSWRMLVVALTRSS